VAIDAQVLLERANDGDAKAAWLLGTRFASGRAGVRDDSEALRRFRRAADLGLPEAQYNLGIMYVNGRGVPKDWVHASRWFEDAAEQGLAQAQCNIGTLYSQGKGVALDDARAVHWLGRAAQSGLAAAQFNLAVLYEHGVGVGRNLEIAVRWYRKAANAGYAPAKSRLSESAREVKRAPRDAERGEAPAVAATASEPKADPRLSPTLRVGAPIRASSLVQTIPRSDATSRPQVRASSNESGAKKSSMEDGARLLAVLDDPDGSGFTIQLSSHRQTREATAFVERHVLGRNTQVVKVMVRGTVYYSVVYGVFSTQALARVALPSLPTGARKGGTWIRSIRGLRVA
jgi:TPR repeat protein